MEVRTSKPETSWRLVHGGGEVIHLFESSGITHTINLLEEFPTKEAALAKVAELKLANPQEPTEGAGSQ